MTFAGRCWRRSTCKGKTLETLRIVQRNVEDGFRTLEHRLLAASNSAATVAGTSVDIALPTLLAGCPALPRHNKGLDARRSRSLSVLDGVVDMV
mmetsp:Transcript_93327/g.267616  ORF Transcript_93327/g.267616 Transcript_93327/m.267616 type:complete len:94 (-) Transcript_93327:137-418(-)